MYSAGNRQKSLETTGKKIHMSWLTKTAARSIQRSTNGTRILSEGILILQTAYKTVRQRSCFLGVHGDISSGNRTSKRTQSKPALHAAIVVVVCAHVPKTKNKERGMAFEKNLGVMVVRATGRRVRRRGMKAGRNATGSKAYLWYYFWICGRNPTRPVRVDGERVEVRWRYI